LGPTNNGFTNSNGGCTKSLKQRLRKAGKFGVDLPDAQLGDGEVSRAANASAPTPGVSRLDRAAIEALIDPADYLDSTQGFIDRVIAAVR
jgi:hypothetical protein